MKLLLALLILSTSYAEPVTWRERWQAFCERHIVADDPYQYEYLRGFPTNELLRLYRPEAIRVRWRKEPNNKLLYWTLRSELFERGVVGEDGNEG